MEFKIQLSNIVNFTINKAIQIFGIIIIVFSIIFMLSLISYSPNDPNFIFPNEKEINNLIGIKGSILSDFFFQSIGLVSVLIPLTFIFVGINIFSQKKITVIIECFFLVILYSLVGSVFLSHFYVNSIWLSINGNGGYVGSFLLDLFYESFIKLNEKLFFYIFIFIISCLFFFSLKLNLKNIFLYFLKKRDQKTQHIINSEKNEEDDNFIQSPLKQENFSFENFSKPSDAKNIKIKLPQIDFLDTPSNTKNEKSSSSSSYNEKSLEKILLDFGVEGKITKVSHGPVVTLNEFEPAAGIKVSKIINLSEDIARNTSSESARISTIPGSSTIGIELPNSSRENVF